MKRSLRGSNAASHQSYSSGSSSQDSLTTLVREKLARIRNERHQLLQRSQTIPSLLEWMPKVSPRYVSPFHLRAAADQLNAFETKPFEFVFSVPPRHGKTLLLLHFIVWALLRNPRLNICYVTYNSDQAKDKSRLALGIAERAGLTLVSKTMARWATPENEHVLWTGVGGPVTGKGFDIILFDDPVKNRAEAESPVKREAAWSFYQSDLATRMEPGCSFACIQTRWHEDDLAGRLTKDDEGEGFVALPYTNIPAIIDEGLPTERALWPERWSLPLLYRRRQRVGEYAWASLFAGQPRPRGSAVFGDPTFFNALPGNYQLAQGLDLSYTEKKTSDWSVIVTMMKCGDFFYVRKVLRRQKRAPDFKQDLRLERQRFKNPRVRIYAAGTETGAVDFLRRSDLVRNGTPLPGLNIEMLTPEGDKFTRAIPFAAAWNAQRVLVPSPELIDEHPEEYSWVHDFLDEMRAFTGVKDAHDDQVDASVAAFDVLNVGGTGYHGWGKVPKPQGRRM